MDRSISNYLVDLSPFHRERGQSILELDIETMKKFSCRVSNFSNHLERSYQVHDQFLHLAISYLTTRILRLITVISRKKQLDTKFLLLVFLLP